MGSPTREQCEDFSMPTQKLPQTDDYDREALRTKQ